MLPALSRSFLRSFRPALYALLALLSFLAVTRPAAGQATAQDVSGEVDEIFSWATPETPGCAVGVSRHGEVIVNRAYGLADLERGIPIGPATVFDIGSVQKQFVAAAVLLLAEDGRLSLTDDIRRYFPEMPDLGHTVTVDHLLTHTSGVRDWVALGNLSSEEEDALTMILRQRGLNFAPGEEWSYSNSGYVLLKELVARTTGTSFAEFAHRRLFEPLGMTSTQYAEDIRAAGENGALAYEREGDAWEPDVMLGEERGGGAVLSTTGDLLLWNEALTTGRLGAFVSGKIQEPARLNNGRELDYARGLFLDEEEGIEVVWHTGSARAYKSMLARLPGHGLSVAVLCNAGETGSRSQSTRRLVDLFAPAPDAAANTQAASADSAGAPAPDLSGRAGLFFSERTGEPLHLVVDEGRLRIAGGPALDAVTGDRFRNPEGRLSFMSGDEFELRFLSPDELELVSMEGEATRYRRAQPYAPTAAERQALVGRYENEELRAVIEMAAGADRLTASLNGSRAFDLTPVERDAYQLGRMTLRFRRDEAGDAVAIDYSNPVLRHIAFTRRSTGTDQPLRGAAATAASAVDPEPEGVPAGSEALVGFYEGAQPGRGITITFEDGTLYGEPTGSDRAPLVLQSGTTYFVGREGAPVTATFTLGPDGGATALVLRRGDGSERTFPRAR